MVELDGQLTLYNEILFVDPSSFNLASGHFTLESTAEIVGESNNKHHNRARWHYIVTTRHHMTVVPNDFGLIGMQVNNGATSMENTEVFRRYGTFDIDGHTTINR